MCRTTPAHTGIGLILDFLWSGVKLPVWLLALLSTITCVADVQMAHARPFLTSTLQGLSNNIKNTSRQGVLTSAIELWSCRSPKGLQVKFPLLGVWVSSSHLLQSRVATIVASLCCCNVNYFILVVIILKYDYKPTLNIIVRKLSTIGTFKPWAKI